MKALLVEKGYSLYTEVWNDQPPVLTYLLALGVRLFGYRVGVARGIVFLLSLGMLWAAFELMQLSWKKSYAYVGCLLVFLLPHYMVLSFSAMVGLPSISFGMFSLLFLVLWHKKRKYFWLILSGVFLSVAVLTKLMIGFLAPIFAIGILIGEYVEFRRTGKWWNLILSAGVWGTIFTALVLGGLAVFVGFSNISQLLENHLAANEILHYASPQFTINYRLQRVLPFIFLAIVGTIFAIKSRRWPILYLTVWALTAYLLLLSHKPVWYHHQLYVTIPVAMLGGIAFVEGMDLLLQILRQYSNANLKGWARAAALVGTLSLMVLVRIPDPFTILSWPPSFQTTGLELGAQKERIFSEMVVNAPKTQWVVTDLPMFAFRAGLAVPPELAVMSEKRFLTEYITQEQIIGVIIQYQPEQILFGRFALPKVGSYLETHYTRILSKDDMILYVRNDLLP